MIAFRVAIAVLLFSPAASAQVRDRAAPAATGTAAISGIVLSDSQPARPVRRATVVVTCADPVVARTMITDDAGRFSATGLPSGRYNVGASKRGWVMTTYGAKAPGRAGRSIALAEGARADAPLKMARGAVITGTLLDPNGLPPTGVTIRVLRYAYVFNTGERRLTPVSATMWGPDDRGVYRVWGLAPGEYYLAAFASQSGLRPGLELHLTSDADVQDALRAAQSPSVPLGDVVQPAVGIAPLYYPGSTNMAQAAPITLRAGEERAGVDFAVQYVTTSHVEGIVSFPGGSLPPGTQVNLISTDGALPGLGFEALRTARLSGDGHFDFADVAPGEYILTARTAIPSGAPDTPAQVLSSTTDVEVHGEDLRGLSLTLQDGLTVSGVVRADGASPPPQFSSMRISLQPLLSSSGVTISSGSATVRADGRFTITGVTPGRYRLLVASSTPQSTWVPRSATIDGQNALDTPVDVRQSIDSAMVTLSDRVAELKGRIEGTATDYTVLLFSENRTHWIPPARRILTARAASDGFFQFKNVPPGDYLMTALEDPEPGEWLDPALLQRVSAGAVKVTIAEGEKKVQDLKLGGA